MRKALVALIAAVTAVALVWTAAVASASAVPGAAGLGDEYFPDYGNGGYDAGHYDIRLRYFPDTDKLTGTTTILATATQDLESFHLDFLLDTESVVVNNRPAAFVREGEHELVVTPAQALTAGQAMTVVVKYSGVPSDKTFDGWSAWTRTPDGAVAVGEPEIAWWWFPSNDHPQDKATFDVSVAVPDGVQVLSNGVQPRQPTTELQGWKRWYWRSTKPQATHLTFVAIGSYAVSTETAPNGLPVVNAYSTLLSDGTRDAAKASIGRTPEIVDWEASLFGPYPFEAQGGVVVPPGALRFALENQTRPVYSEGFFRGGTNTSVVVHELAHQWFGDSVSVAQWKDTWLNEGFASYAQWLWSEKEGEGTAQEIFDFVYAEHPADDPFWTVAPAEPGAEQILGEAVYDRGAMAVHQLRLAVGDEAFFRIVREWTTTRQHGNGTTEQFVTLAESVSGKQLGDLFQSWLHTAGKPDLMVVKSLRAPRAPKSWPQINRTNALLAGH